MLSHTDIAQLGEWLAATDIAVLELHGPSGSLRLERRGDTVEAHTEMLSSYRGWDAATDGPPEHTVAADTPGIFLHHHPLHSASLVKPGASVIAGQVLALLQIGSVLLAVRAPRAGRVEGYWVEHGAPVGYGTPLIELSETTQ
jgi:acetyl-CoA carboxylase biotin carboxyl carrier protein